MYEIDWVVKSLKKKKKKKKDEGIGGGNKIVLRVKYNKCKVNK